MYRHGCKACITFHNTLLVLRNFNSFPAPVSNYFWCGLISDLLRNMAAVELIAFNKSLFIYDQNAWIMVIVMVRP